MADKYLSKDELVQMTYRHVTGSLRRLRSCRPGSRAFSENYLIITGGLVHLRKLSPPEKEKLDVAGLEKLFGQTLELMDNERQLVDKNWLDLTKRYVLDL